MTRRNRSRPVPLDDASLRVLAGAYTARFQTTRAKLAAYLQRKLRERGWSGEGDPPVAGVVARMAELGTVDDAAWAQARAGVLERRGLGARRVADGLAQGGIERETRSDLAARADPYAQALAYARRRRLGAFRPGGSGGPELARRDMAAMLRAGHAWAAAKAALGGAADTLDPPDPDCS